MRSDTPLQAVIALALSLVADGEAVAISSSQGVKKVVVHGPAIPDAYKLVRRREGSFALCHARLRPLGDAIGGEHEIEFVVQPDGTVRDVKVLSGNLKLQDCLEDELPRALRFPEVKEESLVVVTWSAEEPWPSEP